MNLSELSKIMAGVLANVWHYHHLTTNYNEHLQLNDLYKELIEDFDNLCETCVEHTELPSSTINAEEDVDKGTIMMLLEIFLESLEQINGYNKGVDNMVGNLAEKYSKWRNYFLSMEI